jgi:hypothetical protein
MNGPERVFLDPRIADRLPNTLEEAVEAMAQGGEDPIGYVRQDLSDKRVREASNLGNEILITIQAVGPILYALSNQGRLYAHGQVDGGDVGWNLIAERELEP